MRLVPCSPPERRIAPAGSRLPAASLTPSQQPREPHAQGPDAGRRDQWRQPRGVTHLEAFGRLIAGLAPWLDVPARHGRGTRAGEYAALARRARRASIRVARLHELHARPPAARRRRLPRARCAHRARWSSRWSRRRAAAHRRARVDARDRARLQQLAAVLRDGRSGPRSGAGWDRLRVDYALRQHEQWYKGDGVYGDGPQFHWDYYNASSSSR